MKKFIAILILALGVVATTPSALAQDVATMERVPRAKLRHWLNGHIPVKSDFTYIGFIHSASVPCVDSTLRIVETAGAIGMSAIIATKESQSRVEKWLYRVTNTPHSGVLYDAAKIFEAFGIEYAPFGVIIDHKRRALWFGNPNRLTQTQIIELIDNHKNNHKRCRSRK